MTLEQETVLPSPDPDHGFASIFGETRGEQHTDPQAHPLLRGVTRQRELQRMHHLLATGELEPVRQALRDCWSELGTDLAGLETTSRQTYWNKAKRLARGNTTHLEALLVAYAEASAGSGSMDSHEQELCARKTGLVENVIAPGAAFQRAFLDAQRRALVHSTLLFIPTEHTQETWWSQYHRDSGDEIFGILHADWLAAAPREVLLGILGNRKLEELENMHLFSSFLRRTNWEFWQVFFADIWAATHDPEDLEEPFPQLVAYRLSSAFDASFDRP